MMYSDVVMEKAAGIEPKGKGIRKVLDEHLEHVKKSKGYTSDTDLTAEDLKQLCTDFKHTVQEVLGKPFPDDHMEQLWGGISAVFASWNGKRAIEYRRIEKIPDEWGTAVNVQSMVFGNMGDDCATGVAFTRNPGNGENQFYGEYLVNAQGEDVVAGIRTPAPDQRILQERPERAPAHARAAHAEPLQGALRLSRGGSRSTTRTCRTSSSRSRRAACSCSSAASASATAWPRCAWPSRCRRRS